jgi:F-type H+-transporting ATPase subunit epsilon
MAELKFELVTPEGVKFTESAYEVMLPTPEGEIAILPHHIPLVSLAVPGVVSIRRKESDKDSQLEHFAVSGGLIEISGSNIRLLADTAEHAEDVDEMRAKEALERAHELAKTAKDDVSLADATAAIERNLGRLKVAELKKRRHPRA